MINYNEFYKKETESSFINKIFKKRKISDYFTILHNILLWIAPYITMSFWSFYFKWIKMKYFCHLYNTTYRNERAIELPILDYIINDNLNNTTKILEIWNVLSHYKNISLLDYTIVDKFDNNKSIIKEDAEFFNNNKLYDLIISISTFEHIWFDDDIKDSNKSLRTFNNMKKLLNDWWKMIITIPVWWNKDIDKKIFDWEFDFNENYYYTKNKWNWIESTKENTINLKYDIKIPSANWIFIWIYNK